jgi:hypothetical protein
MEIRALLVLTIALGLASTPADARLYRWVDADGVVTYSDRPPPGEAAEEIRPARSHITDEQSRGLLESLQDQARTGAEDREFERTVRADETEREARIRQNCEIARQNLRVLEHSPRVQDTDADGNRYFLGDAERATRIAATREQVSEYCGD